MAEPELTIDVESGALGPFHMSLTFHARVTGKRFDGDILDLEATVGGARWKLSCNAWAIAWPDESDRSAEWIKVTLQAVEP